MTYQCRLCLKQYSNQSNLNQHMRNKHTQLSVAYEKSNLRCLEDGCNSAFMLQRKFRNHLTEEHGIQFEEMVFTVATMSEFEEWKRKMENETISFYRIHEKSTNSSSYNCNRSGTKGNKRSNVVVYKRREKSQRSCKMTSKCTSCIKLDFKNPAEIKVHWVKTHYGHDLELQHIRLPYQDRLLVATKLISGIPPTRILQATSDSISSHPKRVDLLTRQDVRNIKMRFKIECDRSKRHTRRDAISSIDSTKGKTAKIKRINFLRHNDGLSKSYNLIERDGGYHITTNSLKSYDIKKVMGTKCCENLCTTCEICRHMYTCTCPDFLQNNSICKHIHYVVMHGSKFAPSTGSSLMVESLNNDGVDSLAQQLDFSQKSGVDEKYKRSENAKQAALSALLAVNFEEYDDDVLEEMNSCLAKFVHLTSMKKTLHQQPIKHESVNKLKINPQKKRKSTTNVCRNPEIREAEDIKNILTGGSS